MMANYNAMPRCPRGFTLLELIAVLLIVGILAAMATFKFRGLLEPARVEHDIQRIVSFDRHARYRALHSNKPVEFSIDAHRGVLRLSGKANHRKGTRELFIKTLRIEGVRLGEHSIRSGKTKIKLSSRGRSPTYFLQFVTPQGQRRWLLFCGTTGQVIQIHNAQRLRDLQHLLSTQQPHVTAREKVSKISMQ